MKVRRQIKLKEMQEEERKKQLERGEVVKIKPIEVIEEELGGEDSDGIKDMDEFRAIKFKENDPKNGTVELKQSIPEFDPNYGARIGEKKKKLKIKNSSSNPNTNPETALQTDS
jgi:hypothetical protein